MAEIEMTIIIMGEMIPADTAASPKIRPPRMETALPMEAGFRISLSLRISKEILINRASIKAEKGTLVLCAEKFKSKSKGSMSWLWVVRAIYKPGIKIAIRKAKRRINLRNVIFDAR